MLAAPMVRHDRAIGLLMRQDMFTEVEGWLNAHLERPTRLSSSKKPDAKKIAITWMQLSATEHVAKLRDLARILTEKGVPVEEVRTQKPGDVVYEDEHQVAAIPFRNLSMILTHRYGSS